MRTATLPAQAVLAQLQSKLAGTAQASTSGARSSTTEEIETISPVLAKVHERISAQAQSTTASLSALGSYKADLFTLGSTGQQLASLSDTSSPEAVQAALAKLVADYNASLLSGHAATGTSAAVARTQRELAGAMDSLDLPRGNLAKLGIVRGPNGTLVLDRSMLPQTTTSEIVGLASTLSQIGTRIGTSVTSALAPDSRLDITMERLGDRAQLLNTQQAAVVSTASRFSALNSAGSSWSSLALSAYRNAA
jgi:hypothetical protein